MSIDLTLGKFIKIIKIYLAVLKLYTYGLRHLRFWEVFH